MKLRLVLVGTAAIALVSGSARSTAGTAPSTWVVNGTVAAMSLSGSNLYIGGDFTQISPHTGPLVAFSSATGQLAKSFPAIDDGQVNAVAPDGHGGWFVGGEFAQIGGIACANLA